MGVTGNPLNLGVLEKRVKDMVVGEKGFIEYRAICFIEGQVHCLNLCANVYPNFRQKKGMPIERIGKRKIDYVKELD
ncbi:hypothetical protein FJZ18_01255 [Candidatus Pacearchaeota archaeon]|nr:hypothetical protein [Candidatus Pacearchaeota archaeon]